MKSRQVLDKAIERGTAVHARTIATLWNKSFEDIYDCWGKALWSNDFLSRLVELANLVGFEQGQGLLLQNRNSRGGSPQWLASDVVLAVESVKAMAKELTGSPTPGERKSESSGCDARDSIVRGYETRSEQVEDKQLRHMVDSHIISAQRGGCANKPKKPVATQTIPLSLSNTAAAVSTSGTRNPPTSCSRGSVKVPHVLATTPAHPPPPALSLSRSRNYPISFSTNRRTAAPPTPPSSVSVRELSPCRGAGPLKRKRDEQNEQNEQDEQDEQEQGEQGEQGEQDEQDEQDLHDTCDTHDTRDKQATKAAQDMERIAIIVQDGDTTIESPCFLDDQAMQKVFDSLTQQSWINDDCINVFLEAFNPDLSLWYVASTHLVTLGKHADTVSRFKDVASLPEKLLFPVHLPSMSHWTLAVYDRRRKHCIVYDPKGSSGLAWDMVRGFLERHDLLPRDVTVDLDPFPSVRQSDDVNCGVFVIATALHLLHDKAFERVTPGLWRELLATFFATKREPPRGWIENHLASVRELARSGRARKTTLESILEDVKVIHAALSDIRACTKEIRILLRMAELQIEIQKKREEDRSKLEVECDWLSSKPSSVDGLIGTLVFHREKDVMRQLNAVPKGLRGGSQQLRVLKDSSVDMIEDCNRVALTFEQRKKHLIDGIMMSYQDIGRRLVTLSGSTE